MSLRARVIAAVSLIALVLVVVLVFVARTTEENLVDQVDGQLADALQPVRRVELGDRRFPGGRDDAVVSGGPELSSLYVGFVANGALTTIVEPGLRGEDVPLPAVDPDEAAGAAQSGDPFTVSSSDSGLRWRMRAYERVGGGAVIVIGLPLDTVDDTISDLVALELMAGSAILVTLALVAIWVIRLGVRPVKKMTEVATAIAAGDLTKRVPDTNPDTEAGELGDALNKMLASIEASFAERQRVEERLRQFVADASHELRTPVATIRGYAELYRTGALQDSSSLDDAMRRTEQESVRMAGLVDDMLVLARLDEGRPLDLGPVDLSLVAQDAANDARAVDPGRSVSAEVPGPVVVQADEAKVRQLVANLVGNAVLHTPPDASVTVTTGSTPEGRPFLEVIDDGPGMPPEVAVRAFERFYRADPARSRHQGGSGLGLAIVDATVRAHRGTVTLDSTPGDGTTVRIELPRPAEPGPRRKPSVR